MLILGQPTQLTHSLHENKSVSNRWAEFRPKYGSKTGRQKTQLLSTNDTKNNTIMPINNTVWFVIFQFIFLQGKKRQFVLTLISSKSQNVYIKMCSMNLPEITPEQIGPPFSSDRYIFHVRATF